MLPRPIHALLRRRGGGPESQFAHAKAVRVAVVGCASWQAVLLTTARACGSMAHARSTGRWRLVELHCTAGHWQSGRGAAHVLPEGEFPLHHVQVLLKLVHRPSKRVHAAHHGLNGIPHFLKLLLHGEAGGSGVLPFALKSETAAAVCRAQVSRPGPAMRWVSGLYGRAGENKRCGV